MQQTTPLSGRVRQRWCSYERSHVWLLAGTGTVLDGTVLATPLQAAPFPEQTRQSIATINQRRGVLGLCSLQLLW